MIMGRAKQPTTKELNITKNYHDEEKRITKIARVVLRSECVPRNFIPDPSNYGKKRSRGQLRIVIPD